jgi:hypothetical protein
MSEQGREHTQLAKLVKEMCVAHCDGLADTVAFVLMTLLFLIYPPDDSLFSLGYHRSVVKSKLSTLSYIPHHPLPFNHIFSRYRSYSN